MIITKLIGGLGNQLFQYSLGRHLSIKNNTQLKLGISGFETYKLHKYSLNNFNIIENIASDEELKHYKKYNYQTKIGKLFNLIESLKPLKLRTYIKEPHFFKYYPQILNLGDNIYLDGYWQSEKYFKEIGTTLRQEFTAKKPLDENLLNAVINCDSISIHVRRTDYITNQRVNKIHGACSVDYYESTVNRIKQIIKQPHFFVFSDDIEWAKNNLRLESVTTFVEHGAEKNYEDLILMSKCKHNIIANSSFSWWGAWLNNNPNKIIIAPKNWFNDNSKNTSDLLPNNWIKI